MLQEEVSELKEAVIGLQMMIADLTEKVNAVTELALCTPHWPPSDSPSE